MIKIITSLVAVLTVVSAQSQTSFKETPKLVVGITIDQLRGDYLELFQHTFTEKGFKRLLNEGLVYQNMTFDFPNINSPAAIATIYTGANPFYHGIISDKKISPERANEVPFFNDDAFLGNYTQDKLSPTALKVSTIADELKLASHGFSDVYSFAPDASQALTTAGHAANCAYWVDDYTGKWATSTFYKDFHWVVDKENRSGTFSGYVGSLSWKPVLSIENYKAFPYTTNRAAFQHLFNSYMLVKKTPLVNEQVRNTSMQLLEKAEMGKRTNPDFLALTFYLGNYPKSIDKTYSLEIQDAYARLDRELGLLLDNIDKLVGLKNTLIFVTSTGYYDSEEIYPDGLKMPGGVFYTNRCEALLNMYLMAIYGKEQWVEKLYNKQIYLNRKLIKEKNLNLEEVQNKAAEFVVQFTGVQDVATSIQLLNGRANDNMTRYKNILNKDVCGDIFIEIQPGYKIINEQERVTQEKRERETATTAPAIFFGNGIKAEKVKRTIKATEIAPTVSHILRIRSPNAAKSQALPEFLSPAAGI
ncbi:alkaline phosphatase family protein [Viscerimonas tarda]